MNIVDWPPNIIPMAESLPRLERNTASGGQSQAGPERIVVTNAGRWRWSVRVGIRTVAQMRAWRGLVAQAEGRGNAIRVPYYDETTDLAAWNGEREARSAVTAGMQYTESGDLNAHDDGTLLADTVMPATVVSKKLAGLSVIRLAFASGLVCEPGDYFSTGNRMYQVRQVADVSTDTYDVTISPPLRETLLANSEVSFDQVSCLMRFEDEGQLDLDQDPAFMGDLMLTLVEAF